MEEVIPQEQPLNLWWKPSYWTCQHEDEVICVFENLGRGLSRCVAPLESPRICGSTSDFGRDGAHEKRSTERG
jgi:hypothetical protein